VHAKYRHYFSVDEGIGKAARTIEQIRFRSVIRSFLCSLVMSLIALATAFK